MTMPVIKPSATQAKPQSHLVGKDEMNLAEFPLTRLGTRDKRDVLTYEGWMMDARKGAIRQKWTVRGAAGLGLPNEFGDRVMLALMALTFEQGLVTPKVEFSRYNLLKIIGIQGMGSSEYALLEKTLLQMAGMTIESEQAFYDKTRDKRLSTKKAFHLLEKLWLRKQEAEEYDAVGESTESANGFVVWGREFWDSLRSGYIKNLDLDFYYGLSTPLARRLYRFLDKRMHHKRVIEIDIFDLSSRLGQVPYRRPSEAFRKMKPSIDELITQNYLATVELVKHNTYTRIRFNRTKPEAFQEHQIKQSRIEALTQNLQDHYQTSTKEGEVWKQVLQRVGESAGATHQAILADSMLLSLVQDHAVILVPHSFAVQYLAKNTRILGEIREALALANGGKHIDIEFVDRKGAQKAGIGQRE